MKKIDISVIVPIYNMENYLEECIENLVKQDYENYEIILVNDGSTDNSLEICEKYQKQYPKINLFSKENGGLSDARNFGLNKAKGKYVFFVDSDDIIQTNTLSSMMNMLKRTKADIAICSFEEFKEKYNVDNYDENKNEIFKIEDYFYSILKLKNNTFACGCLIPKKYFENVKFPLGKYFEDLATMYKIFEQASNVVTNPVNLYKYRYNPNSIIHTPSLKKSQDYIMAANEMVDFLKKHYAFDEDIINTYLCNVYLTSYIYYKDEAQLEKIKDLKNHINLKDVSLMKKIKLTILKYSSPLTKLIMKIK